MHRGLHSTRELHPETPAFLPPTQESAARTRMPNVGIGDTPVVDQEAIYDRVIGLFISNRSLDFNVILTNELSAYPPSMVDPTGQSAFKKSLQVEIPMPTIE